MDIEMYMDEHGSRLDRIHKYCICCMCGVEIEQGYAYYRLRNGESVHPECLREWSNDEIWEMNIKTVASIFDAEELIL